MHTSNDFEFEEPTKPYIRQRCCWNTFLRLVATHVGLTHCGRVFV